MKNLLTVILLMISTEGIGQTIASLLRTDWNKGDSTIASIEETRVTYLGSKVGTIKSKYHYDANGFLTMREDHVLEHYSKTKIRFYYDSNNNLSSRTIQNWVGDDRYQKDSLKYTYEKRGLKSITFFNRNSQITSYAEIKTIEGLPVEIATYNSDRSIIGKEKATNDLVNNKAFTSTYNAIGQQIGNRIEIVLDDEKERDIEKNKI